ncbi:MAG: hypothetical protein JWL59_1923 [Chthoniobacteraceae bacterium]|nr:hypothetical protein [Chthoniobacteraceae bacterium]
MNIEEEVCSLRDELEILKKQIAGLQEFLVLKPADEQGAAALTIHCQSLTVERDDDENNGCAQITFNNNGPAFYLWHEDEEGNSNSVELDFDSEGFGHICIIGADEQPRLDLAVENGGHGRLGVFSPGGIPCAVVKAMPGGGALSVLAPSGKPLAFLTSASEHGGELALINHAQQAVAKAVAAEHGGIFLARRCDGEVAAFLAAADDGGVVTVMSDNDFSIALHASPENALLGISCSSDERSAIILTTSATQSSMQLRGNEGKLAVRLTAHSTGNGVDLFSPEGNKSISIDALPTGGLITLSNPEGNNCGFLSAGAEGGMFGLHPPKKPASDGIILTGRLDEAAVLVGQEGKVLGWFGRNEGGGKVIVRASGESDGNAQLFAHPHGANLLLQGADGLLQAGFGTTPDGGQLAIYNELGIERAHLAVARDGGALKLNWGGTMAVAALGTDHGGAIVTYDEDGEVRASLPARGDCLEDE